VKEIIQIQMPSISSCSSILIKEYIRVHISSFICELPKLKIPIWKFKIKTKLYEINWNLWKFLKLNALKLLINSHVSSFFIVYLFNKVVWLLKINIVF
jgi:hypothetical protein